MDALVTQPHHLAHAAPVWAALDPSLRGRLFVGFDAAMPAHAARYGFDAHAGHPPESDVPVLVASGNELVAVKRAILLSHGVDQTYLEVDHASWAGGIGRDNVALFLCPNEASAEKNRARYPNAPAVVVGSPHVEALRKLSPYPLDTPRVAISAHWECGNLVPELRSGFAWFEDIYEKLCRERPDAFVLHGHPRFADLFEWKAREWGVEYEPSFERLTQRAFCYITDNSSTLYEWAALDRPVVVVSPPWYREDAGHGLRFNEYRDAGPHVRDPQELEAAIYMALADVPAQRERRREISRALFGDDLSRGAAQRAADAIAEVVG